MKSLWSDSARLPSFTSLDEDKKTDVLIIGGGMAGILCAHMLHRAGADYILAEADRICGGITRNTTAKITSQHGLIYSKLLRRFGSEKAKMYLDANENAIEKFRELCRPGGSSDMAEDGSHVDCHFEEKPAFVYTVDSPAKIEREFSALEKIGYKAEPEDWLPLPFQISASIKFRNQAQFDPLAFVSRICEGLNVFEQTKITELEGNTAHANGHKIEADNIIVATHFPFLNKHGSYFIKMYQQRSYVVALESAQDVKGMYIDESGDGLSFRNFGDLLLVGGGGHKTGKAGGGFRQLKAMTDRYYPQAREKFRWAAQDCMTLDGVPYIGRYSSSTPNLFVATGFNKWGMTSSMAAASILTDMIMGRDNQYAPVFSPSRSILRPQLLVNGFNAVTHLLKPAEKRCPHMGCALSWNPQERTWDCPCHGSRFSEDGALLDNPATGDLPEDDLPEGGPNGR